MEPDFFLFTALCFFAPRSFLVLTAVLRAVFTPKTMLTVTRRRTVGRVHSKSNKSM